MSQKVKILVVDDEPVVCRNCFKILTEFGYEVETLQSSRTALERVKEEFFDVIILDLKIPGIDGLELLRLIKEINSEIIIIMITGYSTVESAVDSMKLGAFDYIPKPFTPSELSVRVEKALEKRSLVQENRYLREELKEKYKFGNIIGKSKRMQEVYQTIEKVASIDSAILIYGENGSGKELIARAIHYNSPRKGKPFISLHCDSLTELLGHLKDSFTGTIVTKPGIFETAEGGTFFLDEIGALSLPIQAKLLRILQEREIKPVGTTKTTKSDIRFIAATNKNLSEMIKKQTFREDLFYRLSVVPIFLPSLRDREGDIPLLVSHFLEKFNQERKKNIKGISSETMKLLEEYNWPGNVRELENIVERIVVMTNEEVIRPEHLPLNIQKNKVNTMTSMDIPKNSEEFKKLKKRVKEESIKNIEKLFVNEALKRNNWNITKAAEDVGMKRQNFQTLIKKHQIKS